MTLREFWRFHFLKALLGLVAIQLVIVAIIQNYNHRPVAVRDVVSMIEGRELKLRPVSNDTDKDDNTELKLLNHSEALNGTLEPSGNYLVYKPNAGFIGTDSLWYTVSDGKKESKPAYIVIKVNENLPPNVNRDVASVYVGSSTVIYPLSNDNDAEGDSIFIKTLGEPRFGKLKAENNMLLYTPTVSTAAVDSFYYTLGDGKSDSAQATVVVNIKSKNDPCYPWLGTDLGNVQIPGGFTCQNGTIKVQASGTDIWDSQDGFYFVYQQWKGDCELIAKVESLDAKNEWAKAGLMIRETLDAGSRNAFLGMSLKHGAGYQARYEANDGSNGGGSKEGISVPYWIKLNRMDSTFTASVSPDGKTWEQVGSVTMKMAKNTFVGFGTSSHNNSEINKAVYSNFKIK